MPTSMRPVRAVRARRQRSNRRSLHRRGPGGNTYYDDNAWAALDLIAAYRLTGSSIDLFVAQVLFNFVLTGWDTSQTDGCPGGVFWEDVSGSQRNTTANAANAEVGLELYQLTKNSTDLSGRP
jgi:predicted alpha-1,6-mannanase (GH76 family)